MSRIESKVDKTDWLSIENDYINSHIVVDIYDIVYVNEGCSDMHHSVVFSDGETLSLALGV